jgi:hypothetical protein
MSLTIALFSIILLLLAVIVAMMVAGWPGRERAEIEKAGAVMRREMAEHHAESIRLLHAIRIEVEDSVKESIAREFADLGTRGGKGRGARGASRLPVKSRMVQPEDPDTASSMQGASDPEEFQEDAALTEVELRQLPLFPENSGTVPEQAPAQPAAPVSPKPDTSGPEPETIHMGYVDDIPDVE